MIELNEVTKRYRTRTGWNTVLDSVTAEFPQGVGIGILGRNGAGKSTLLRILGGSEEPDAGTISRNARVSWPIGFSGGLHPDLTGRENSRFVARIYGLDVEYLEAYAADFAEIGDYFDMPIQHYSTGMRARLAFGISMAAEFDYYLVDEVTAVGDQLFQDKCRAAFVERRGKASIIIVSHSVGTIRSYCDQVALLRGGTLQFFKNIDEGIELYNKEATIRVGP